MWSANSTFGRSQSGIGLALLLASVGLTGCGGSSETSKPRGAVVLTVTYDGQPVTEGRVDLSDPKSGEGGGGELDSSGTVVIKEVVLGEYKVTVVPPSPDPRPPEPGEPPRVQKEYPNIPQKYRIAATSDLRAEVKAGSTDYKFELKK